MTVETTTNIPKKTRAQILAVPKVSAAVDQLRLHLLLRADTTPDSKRFIRSIFVIGNFTNPDECNVYSDVDLVILIPLSIFKDQSSMSQTKELLHKIEKQVQSVHPQQPDLHIWPKPIEWYENLRPFMEGDLSDTLWLYKHQEERENYYSSSTPYDLLALDGWSGLASDTLLHYEKSTAVLLEGKDVFSTMKLPETIHKHEWFELALVASRELAIGFAQRADGWQAIHEKEPDGDSLIQRGERQIGKAVLRMFYAQEILEAGQPLNTYKAIRDWALDRYSFDDRMIELVENAFRAKVFLERTLLCSTAGLMPIVLADPEMTVVAPIVNLFSSTIGMKKRFIYPMKGFVQIPFKPGVREFYWERTLPNLIKLLVGRDINPMILTIFIPEIRDYLVRDLSYLTEKGISEAQISDPETTTGVIAILERCLWFYLGYDPKSGGSPYDWIQMTGPPYGKERLKKIDSIATEILYEDESLLSRALIVLDKPDWLKEQIIDAIDTLVGVLALYGTKSSALVGNELVVKAYTLYKKMVAIFDRGNFSEKYSNLRYEYLVRLGRILKMNVNVMDSNQAALQIEEAISWYEKAIRLNPDREEAHYYLGDMYMTFGMPEQAKECSGNALKADPLSARALALYVDVHELTPLNANKSDAIKKCKELEGKNSAANLGLVKLTFPEGLNERDIQIWLDKHLGDNWETAEAPFRFWPTDLMMALASRTDRSKS